MKTILIILDGVSEEKNIMLNNMTPLEYANTKVLNKLISNGSKSKTTFYPPNKEPDSLNCILSILGLEESLIPRNRAYLESLAAGIKIEENEAVLRCNLASIKDNVLESFNGKGLTSAQMKEFALNVKTNNNIKFYHISDYRNLIVVKKTKVLTLLKDIPPHENIGQSIDEIIENIQIINILNDFIEENKLRFNDNDYMFYPWGVSESIKLPSFLSLHNKSCSCVCNAEIVKGIAKAMEIDLVELKNSTGDTDTDLYEKAHAVLRETKTHDVVIAHINGTDEVSHRKDTLGKIKFIEKIDQEFLGEIYNNIDKNTNIIIVSDHQTSSITGKHEKGFVDVVMS
jgi:2,3-bisphosphoglycerate-independent phosphoglycerate mutase